MPICENERRFSKALGAGVDTNRSAKVQDATSIDLRNHIESHVVHHNTERNKEPRIRMMRLSKRLAFFVAWSICSEGRAYPWPPPALKPQPSDCGMVLVPVNLL